MTLALIEQLTSKLTAETSDKTRQKNYYTGNMKVEVPLLTIPEAWYKIVPSLGWCAKAVNVIDDKLQFNGFATTQGLLTFGAKAVNKAITDMLIYGVGWVSFDSTEPIRENPEITTGIFDPRTGELTSALVLTKTDENNAPIEVLLFTPETTETWGYDAEGKTWRQLDATSVDSIRIIALQAGGTAITKPLRDYTDEGIRCLVALAIHREFTAHPRQFILNVPEDLMNSNDFKSDIKYNATSLSLIGSRRTGSTDLDAMQLAEFQSKSNTDTLKAFEMLAVQAASETNLPPSEMGVVTTNPTSADALNAQESKLNKRINKIINELNYQLAKLASAFDIGDAVPDWQPVESGTFSANGNTAAQLIQLGVISPESQLLPGILTFNNEQTFIWRAEKGLLNPTEQAVNA